MLLLSFPRQKKLAKSTNVVGIKFALSCLGLKSNRTNEAIEYNFFFH